MKNILSILITFFCLVSVAQPPQRFYTTFGGNGIDIGYSAKQTLDKQYIITGSTSSYGAGNTDVYLVKLDSMGQILWQKTFGGFANDVGKSVIQVPDSGYIVAGFTSSFGAGGYDAYILRTDKAGTLIWQKTFGGSDWDFAYDLVYTPDADIAVIGSTSSFGAGKKDGFVLKYDFLGNLIWHKEFGGVEDDELKSIIKTNDNFLATVGYTQSKGDINGDCYFLKLNLNGDTLFTKTVGAQYKDYANDLVQKASDDYVICGAKAYSLNAKTSSYMYSINQAGSFLWDNNYLYDNTISEEFSSLCNVSYLPTYTAYNRNISIPGKQVQDLLMVCYTAGWVYIANDSGGNDDDLCYSVESTKDGGYVEVGTTTSFGSLNGDIYFVKRDSTIITYSSVVGVSVKTKNQPKFKIIRLNENEVNVIIENNYGFQNFKISSIDGVVLASENIEKKDFIIQLRKYPKGLLIFSFYTKEGGLYNYKIIN